MINHLVLFQLKERNEAKLREEVELFQSMLLALPPIILELKHLEVGINYQLDEQNYHLSIISHFESFEALKIYATHPEHVKVTSYFKDKIASRAAVDYEF